MTLRAALAALAVGLAAAAPPAETQPMSKNTVNITEQNDRNYEALLRSNPAFRAKRIAEECGGIEDAEVRKACLDTFPPPDPAAGRGQRASEPTR